MSITNFRMENNTHECQECGMKFYNAHELVNHVKKFCTGAGLNSLQGLAQYQQSNNYSKKLKNYGAHSLGSMKYQPVFSANELAKQAKDIEMHRQQLAANRQYTNANYQLNSPGSHVRNNNEENAYMHSVVRKVQMPQAINSRAAYGSRVLGESDVSIKALNGFNNNGGKGTLQSNRNLNNSMNEYVSPPSDVPMLFVKNRPGPSMLDKSNSSIAQMSVSQRRGYASDKLVQLDHIADMYDKSGGMNMDFRKNLEKMKKFYKKMLEDQEPTKQYPGEFAISRAQTPISRLRDLQDQTKNQRNKKNAPVDSLDLQLKSKLSGNKAKPQQVKNSRTQQQNTNQNHNQNTYTMPNGQFMAGNMTNPYYMSQPFSPYNQMATYPPQPQIIMIPPYPQTQTKKNDGSQVNQQIKYFQKMMEVKNEENRKLMQMLMDTKREKNQSRVAAKVEQIRQSRISQIQSRSSLVENNIYHMQTPLQNSPSAEQKILLALQRQELDQLRLLSSLPPELQELKMMSVMKIIEQRTELEKQILQQKVHRLQEQQRNQLYEEKVRIEKDDWANQQRKKLIGYQMNNVIQQLHRKINGEDSDEDEEGEENTEGLPGAQQ